MQTEPERQSVCRVEPSTRVYDQKQMLEDLQAHINRGTDGGATEGMNTGHHKCAVTAKGRRQLPTSDTDVLIRYVMIALHQKYSSIKPC